MRVTITKLKAEPRKLKPGWKYKVKANSDCELNYKGKPKLLAKCVIWNLKKVNGETDIYGRKWPFPKNELCPVCVQPDSCGDCNHMKLSERDVLNLLGKD